MTDLEFHNQYWKQYILIEKEFKASIKYVAIDNGFGYDIPTAEQSRDFYPVERFAC